MGAFSKFFQKKKSERTHCKVCSLTYKFDAGAELNYCDACDGILHLLPPSSSYLIRGRSGAGKSLLCYKLIELYLRNNQRCMYATLAEFPNKIRDNIKRFQGHLSQNVGLSNLTMVDCYSCIAKIPSTEDKALNEPGNLTDLSIMISDFLGNGGQKVFVDPATTLFTHRQSEDVLKFLSASSPKVKAKGGSIFYVIAEGALNNEAQRRIEELVDVLIEIRLDESSTNKIRQFRVLKARGTSFFDDWLPYYIGTTGIHLAPPNDPESAHKLAKELLSMREKPTVYTS